MDVLLQKSFHNGEKVCIIPEKDFSNSMLLLLDILSDLAINNIVEQSEICVDVKTSDGIRYPSKAIKFTTSIKDSSNKDEVDKIISDIKYRISRINENIVVHIR